MPVKKWFDFVGWILLTGALAFLRNSSDVWLADLLYFISVGFLFIFLNSTIMTFFRKVMGHFVKDPENISPLAIAVAMWLIAIIQLATLNIVDDLTANYP